MTRNAQTQLSVDLRAHLAKAFNLELTEAHRAYGGICDVLAAGLAHSDKYRVSRRTAVEKNRTGLCPER